MNITKIISAIGNNRSIYPLFVRDCLIENPTKVLIARKENLKESKVKANDATRERFIDEYATSAVWLGGIPLVEFCADKIISKKGFRPDVNVKLFKEEACQGLKYNIDKFKSIAPEAVKDLEKINNNKDLYQKILSTKFVAAVAIPVAIMGFVLPKLNFALTRKVKEKRKNLNEIQKPQKKNKINYVSMQKFMSKNNINFTGNLVSAIANLKTVDKMALTDAGLTVGRISTSRNKDEAKFNAFRMIGSMIINYVTPKYIAKGLDKSADKLFKINVDLDPLIIGNKDLIKAIKEDNIALPKSNSEKDLFEFIDNNPKALFSKFASESKIVSYLENGVRDPRKYVDVKALENFKKQFENFITGAKNSSNIESFVKKAQGIKSANIIANIFISSTLLAFVLPKLQYLFNKLNTNSYSDPGLKE